MLKYADACDKLWTFCKCTPMISKRKLSMDFLKTELFKSSTLVEDVFSNWDCLAVHINKLIQRQVDTQ